MNNLYADIAARTGGNIYIGVVGPVRTGKSTLIKRIMETAVIPHINDPYRAQRATDELPQSGSGRTIMTSEPKFVPDEAVEICPDKSVKLRVRMIDSVGYMVNGAVGAEENGVPRMVSTPWYDHEIPMTEAAELGTKKVMDEHSTIGIVVTTDGSITDIPREDYIEAENRAITDMKKTNKPFLVIVNSKWPEGDEAQTIKDAIQQNHSVQVITADCQALQEKDISNLLRSLLYAFPMRQLHVYLPRWMDAIEPNDPIKKSLYQALITQAAGISALTEAETALCKLIELEQVQDIHMDKIDLGTGTVSCTIRLPEKLFYEILSAHAETEINTDAQLINLLKDLCRIRKEYIKIESALSAVKATGYGIVMPDATQIQLEKPEPIKRGSAYGVKLKAGAPSIHMIRVDIDTEISPMVGDEKQSKDLVDYLTGESPEKLWQSNIFGKSVYDMINEGLASKILLIPEDVRAKFRGTLSRIANEGASGLVTLIF